ncbi:MAG TPA: class I SAM-dependent methyltransferase [Solirubrobacteraceae bacterium]|nr:class I SAM-dependent methyltransferase [Solirubrobacteraceae bacterium]
MPAPATAAEIRDVNTRYHDAAAESYDAKWGIDFGPVGQAQVLTKLGKALGRRPERFGRALEVGAGTGYFSLNLMQAGVVGQAVCMDISPGMLETLAENARRLRLDVETVAGDAEALPLPDASFDLVLGHAVLHHIPDLGQAFAEFHRVLRPGGWLAFAGEPSRYGDRLASIPKRGAVALAPAWRAALRAAENPAHGNGNGAAPEEHGLEAVVDVHAFAPSELRAFATGAGLDSVRVHGEELLASWFGWANRTLEASADPADVPWLWRQYAYRGYLLLQRLDRGLLERRLPPEVFYNLMLAARRPAATGSASAPRRSRASRP